VVQIEIDGVPLPKPVAIEDKVQRLDIDIGQRGRKVRMVVSETYEGFVFRDLFISEVAVNYINMHDAKAALLNTPDEAEAKAILNGPLSPLKRLESWKETSGARRQADAFNESMAQDYEAHKNAQFGDDEAFGRICEAAAEGAPFLHTQVLRYVGAGYRMQGQSSAKRAQKAIRKLKDPNGISALQLGALRSYGPEQEVVQEDVEILTAYMELIGGGNRNLPYWGDTGFALGGIQSFGEPIAIEADRHNQIYVADSGNNRIQVFSDEGRPDRQWGPDADIAEAWFTTEKAWYASGAAAGSENGQWWNPTDVVVIPGKEGDGFAAIDARGHVQIFDQEGRPVISWRVETRNAAEAGVGGESYLSWLPKQQLLFAFIQDEAVGYSLASEELHRWEIEDGIPNAVEVTKKGEILMAFGREVVQYDLGGFRHGTVIDDMILGKGFEDMDLTLDEKQKLWIFTDDGWAYKFKKLGKLEWKINAYSQATKHPRIAVVENILFLSHYDRIEQIDLLQVQLDQQQAAEEAGASE
jgi:hypothetical protein